MDSALLVHRIHFAFTVTFHYLFPQLTMGLAPLIVVLKTIALRRNDETYHQAARFWARIFGINFVLGVVTGIVGIRQYRIVFAGEANHAGTTRMGHRKDAGVALVKLSAAIAERFPQITGPRSVWTTGAIRLEPGQPSIVPGRAEMMFQVRDLETAQLQRFEDTLHTLVTEANAAGPCAVA